VPRTTVTTACYCCNYDRYFWIIATAYLVPVIAIIGCMVVAAVMACSPVPPPAVDDDTDDVDRQVVEEELSGWLKEQRSALKFLAALVVCWIVGNTPVMYLMRGSPSVSVEAALLLVVVGHQLALPIATLVWRRRLWSRLRRFFRRRTASHSGTPRNYDSAGEETIGSTSDVGDRGLELPGPSSGTACDGQDSRSAHDGVSEGGYVTFDGEAVHIHHEGHHRPSDVDEQQGNVVLYADSNLRQ